MLPFSKFCFSKPGKGIFQVLFFYTLSWSPSKSFRVAFRALTSVKDAIFAVFLLIASRKILKNLKEAAMQNVTAQQYYSQISSCQKTDLFCLRSQSTQNKTFSGGCKSTSRIRQVSFLLILSHFFRN